MALETLKGVESIDGFKVVRKKPDIMTWPEFDELRKEYPINITDRVNCISFRIQDGPVKENGVNGCQVDTIIETAKLILEGLNEKLGKKTKKQCLSPEEQVHRKCSINANNEAIKHLGKALEYLEARTKYRVLHGIEGTERG
jgi:hypothetical protein